MSEMVDSKVITNVSNPFNNAPVYYIKKTLSTMKLAREYCSSSVSPSILPGTVFMAGMQTAGRGRVPGRVWEAVKDKNLLFTLVLTKAEMGSNPLSIVIGLGLSKYLENYHQLKPEIKWPNDIYINGKKIAGIIIESRKGLFNIGIGININQTEFPESILDSSTSLSIEIDNEFDLFLELNLILLELKAVLSNSSWQRAINSRLYNIGKKVSVSTGIPGKEKNTTGIVEGIGSAGQLLLKSKGTLKEIYSGEVTL
ncbi:MAG: biotin--[acetyl-CoA-carboxylase] ligase [Spirochaetota bacterium]|nr:biotin--[acetyl-CoA-carboxylase] ligase [Spirochaetota bacterium]